MAASLLAAVPAWLWKLAAGLYAAHEVAKIGGMYGEYKLGQKQITAGVEGQKLQAAAGKMESEKYDKLVAQLLGMRKEESRKEQETELIRALESGATRQTGLVMAMMQAMASQGPTGFENRGAPMGSIVSLLR